MLVPKIPSRVYPCCSSQLKQARASFTACRFAASVNPMFGPTNWSARSCPLAIRRSWYGKLIFIAEIPIRCSQWQSATCPCHLAFQLGRTSTAAPFFPARKSGAAVLVLRHLPVPLGVPVGQNKHRRSTLPGREELPVHRIILRPRRFAGARKRQHIFPIQPVIAHFLPRIPLNAVLGSLACILPHKRPRVRALGIAPDVRQSPLKRPHHPVIVRRPPPMLIPAYPMLIPTHRHRLPV